MSTGQGRRRGVIHEMEGTVLSLLLDGSREAPSVCERRVSSIYGRARFLTIIISLFAKTAREEA
jgi:hypothetical protein